MGCGSSDAEGGSPKASQAINDSFPPFFPSINKQVAMENPRETVSYLHSWIWFFSQLFFNLICHRTWATYEPAVSFQADMPAGNYAWKRVIFLFFHPRALSSGGWTQRTWLILHFVQMGPCVCQTRSCAQGLIVFVVAGGSSGSKQQLLYSEAHLQVMVVGWLSQKMLFPLLLQIIVK